MAELALPWLNTKLTAAAPTSANVISQSGNGLVGFAAGTAFPPAMIAQAAWRYHPSGRNTVAAPQHVVPALSSSSGSCYSCQLAAYMPPYGANDRSDAW